MKPDQSVENTTQDIKQDIKTDAEDTELDTPLNTPNSERKNNAIIYIDYFIKDFFSLILAFLFMFLSIILLSFDISDPSWSRTATENSIEIKNLFGSFGAYTADILYYSFGLSAWWILFFLFFLIFNLLISNHLNRGKQKTFSFSILLIGLAILLFASPIFESLYLQNSLQNTLPIGSGGIVAQVIIPFISTVIQQQEILIISLVLMFVGICCIIQISWILLLQILGETVLKLFKSNKENPENDKEKLIQKLNTINQRKIKQLNVVISNRDKVRSQKDANKHSSAHSKQKNSAQLTKPNELKIKPLLPNLSLLTERILPRFQHRNNNKEIKKNIVPIESQFAEFNCNTKVTSATIGPAFIQYNLSVAQQPEPNQIDAITEQLKQTLTISQLEIKSSNNKTHDLSLQIPRVHQDAVLLRDILNRPSFQDSNQKLLIGLGKDIAGNCVIADLSKMPHLLIAGSHAGDITLSLKSIIVSLLYKATTEEIKFILIDTPKSSLSIFNTIPHLLTPIISNADQAINALNWCVAEMKKRTALLTQTETQSFNDFNDKILDAKRKNIIVPNPFSQNLDDPNELSTLPFLIIIINDLADLFASKQNEVENQILQLSKKAKIIGIHLILTSKHPTIEVLNKSIKKQITTRLALPVTTQIESLAIIDQIGAESLFNKGDALFLISGQYQPIKLHMSKISDREIKKLVTSFKTLSQYVESVVSPIAKKQDEFPIQDDLYEIAVQYVMKSQKTSISSLQRHLRIGYNRANSFLETMQREGIISKAELGATRRVLVSKKARNHK